MKSCVIQHEFAINLGASWARVHYLKGRERAAGVVTRVIKHALHLARKLRLKRFQRQQVAASASTTSKWPAAMICELFLQQYR